MKKNDNNLKKRLFTSVVLMFVFLLFFSSNFFLVYGLIVLGIFSVIEFLQLSKKIIKNNYFFIFLNIFFISYVFLFCLIFILFSYKIELKFILYILLLGYPKPDCPRSTPLLHKRAWRTDHPQR